LSARAVIVERGENAKKRRGGPLQRTQRLKIKKTIETEITVWSSIIEIEKNAREESQCRKHLSVKLPRNHEKNRGKVGKVCN